MFKQMRIFQKMATGVLVVFIGLMVLVGVAAYSRTSGATRQDMSQAHLIRSGALQQSKPVVASAAEEK